MKFSEKLKELMQAKGLSQMDVANLSGISQTIVSRWLRTDLEPRISNLKPLAKALNVRVIDLLEDYSDEDLTETEKTFLALPENKKQMLMEILRVIDTGYKI
ncbi:MAG: helix-turn-helix transcriptional regulator [Candidatus Riflebacteria bacterium]|nr:helix-turn-helix transcriptional regulator [Candidatus Riflebacteria bacterium]